MVYALWSRQAVAELIEQRFGVKLQVRTMGLYLARWGFTPQKPMRKAYEQSPAAVRKWLDEDYPGDCGTGQGSKGLRFSGAMRAACAATMCAVRSYAPQGRNARGTGAPTSAMACR